MAILKFIGIVLAAFVLVVVAAYIIDFATGSSWKYAGLTKVQYEDLQPHNCFYINSDRTDFMINSQDEFQQLFQNKQNPTCKNSSLQEINFSQKTLLVKRVYGCRPDILEKSVYRDDSNKKFIYFITAKQSNLECLMPTDAFVIIPKIPSDYGVEFEQKDE